MSIPAPSFESMQLERKGKKIVLYRLRMYLGQDLEFRKIGEVKWFGCAMVIGIQLPRGRRKMTGIRHRPSEERTNKSSMRRIPL